ncbi:MAG: cobalamin-dependent protein [Candidatus Omnitrophica bacterium]|nr:cobalamin-dependent protein [Candidatus Omnitrophota bacterium]
MFKIILISAPYIDLYGPIKIAAGRYFPLGLGYIAAFLKKNGFQVLILEPEAQNLNYETIGKILATEKPDVVGISSATPNFNNAIKLAKIAKKSCNCKVVYGGVHASALPEFIMNNYHELIDFLVSGEGEYTMFELSVCLKNKESPFNVKGLYFYHNGKVIKTLTRPFIKNIDELPFPDRDLIPYHLFKPNMYSIRYKRCFSMLTSRGCPYGCSFCASYLTMGKQYRTHSAEYVIDEMIYLKNKYNAQQLIINDDSFTLDRNRLIKICENMSKKKLNLNFFCFSQINVVDKEILKLMKSAGCYNIGFGVESASSQVLQSMNKKVPLEKCKEVISAANQLGMKTQAYFIFGKEGETAENIKETIQYAIELNPTLAFFNMLVPYPGTKDFNYFFRNIKLDAIEWNNFVAIGTKSVFEQTCCRNINLEKMIYNANLKFYFRPTKLFHLLTKIKTLYELQAYFKGGLGLILQMASLKEKQY